MKERKIMEKPLKEEKSLEISLRTNQIKILYEIYAKDQAIQRKNFGTVICYNATNARSSTLPNLIIIFFKPNFTLQPPLQLIHNKNQEQPLIT